MSLTSRANGVGARSICEVSARYQPYFGNSPRDRADPNGARWVTGTPVDALRTSVIVLGEIRGGIELMRRRDPERAWTLDRWYLEMRNRLADRVLPIDEPVAEAWSSLGIPNRLPLMDGLLAATAKVHGLTGRNVADIAATGVPCLTPFVE